MRESQLTAAEIIKNVFEGNNLNKVFLNYSNKKIYLKLKIWSLEPFDFMEKQNLL